MTATATRSEMFASLGVIQVVDPLTEAAYKALNEKSWREDLDSSPHGHPWHTSFHASKFPLDSDTVCGRRQLYSLMNIPSAKPVDRAGRTVMAAGKAIEQEIVSTWHRAGLLLSAPPEDPVQTAFHFPPCWLTGAVDAVILPTGWDHPHVVEVKSKDHEVIMEMRRGEKRYDEEHRRQCLTYIGLGNQVSMFLWPEYGPIRSGSIYYMSRQRPNTTFEFFFNLDEEAMELGFQKVKEWKQCFINGDLPPRPKEWSWQENDCAYCPVKNQTLPDGSKVGCKQDVKKGVTHLADSTTIEFAKSINPSWSYEKNRAAVLKRWNTKDPLEGK